jgi:hypothetical protein
MGLCYASVQEAGKHLVEVAAFLRKQRIVWSAEHDSWMRFEHTMAGPTPRKVEEERLFEVYKDFFEERIPQGILVWATSIIREMQA